MNTIYEQLSAAVTAVHNAVGRDHYVSVWAWVNARPNLEQTPTFMCQVGPSTTPIATGYGPTLDRAFERMMEEWKAAGCPTDPNKIALDRLRSEAQKLGYDVVPKTPTPTAV